MNKRYDESKQWYAIHTYSGYEEKVAESIRQRADSLDMKDKIFQALVPKEKTTSELAAEREIWVTAIRREYETMLTRAERLDPSAGAIWGLRYALAQDYDLTLTTPARRAIAAFEGCWRRKDQDLAYRYLGAWSVGKVAIAKGRRELTRELAKGVVRPEPADLVVNPYFLPEARFVETAAWFPDAAAAEQAALEARLPVNVQEFLISAEPRAPARFDPRARVTGQVERGDELEVRYHSEAEALLVVASTYDVGWSAVVDGTAIPVYETATGMLALPVPGGDRAVHLRYRDAWVRVGAGVSAVAALAAGLVALRARRRLRALDGP